MPALDLLRSIEESLMAVGSQQRDVINLPAFKAFIAPGASDHLTFAVPLAPDPRDWTSHIAALKDAFRERNRRPRLEFFQELHPRLAEALEKEGFVCEMRAPVMTLEMASYHAPATEVAARYRRLQADDESFLRRYLQRQSVAYGGTEGEDALHWLPNLRHGLQYNTLLGATLERDGALVAGAVIQIGAGIGELAGVWTDPDWRRRGLAYALCQRLLREYAQAGYALCWLSAAEGAQQLYEKLGFTRTGTQLNYGLPLQEQS